MEEGIQGLLPCHSLGCLRCEICFGVCCCCCTLGLSLIPMCCTIKAMAPKLEKLQRDLSDGSFQQRMQESIDTKSNESAKKYLTQGPSAHLKQSTQAAQKTKAAMKR